MSDKQIMYRLSRRQRGMSLIELMVALVIGMMMSLAIFGVLITFEGQKRTMTSTNDINQSGDYAAFLIDKWVRSAGSGYSQSGLYSPVVSPDAAQPPFGCPLYAANAGGQLLPSPGALPAPFNNVVPGPTAASAGKFRLAPILIGPGQTTPNVSGSPSDVLIIMSGQSGRVETPTIFKEKPVPPLLVPQNTVGFQGNDLALLMDIQPVSVAGTYSPCFIQQIASSFSGNKSVPALTFGGSYYAPVIAGVNLSNMHTDGWVANIGNVGVNNPNPPIFMVLGVGNDNTLFSYDLLQTTATPLLPVADSIFEMHALYGVDNAATPGVDQWVSPSDPSGNYTLASLMAGTDTAASYLKQIKAIRVGLITRTSLPEDTTAAFVAPTSLKLFSDLGTTLEYTKTLTGPQRAFRYRTIEITIPLRNVMTVK